ncbi:MAG TPA: hypothetical protein PKC18_20070, partial [Lacipirellulaceae bacterium]|nr:hypothetical protein [Lacipirellulaceae bacterium]
KVRSPYAGRNPQDAQLRSHDRNLTQQIAALARQFKQTDSEAQRAKLREQITQCITAQFVLRQSLRALELAELEAQLGRLRAVHNRRTAEQERIVSDRVEQVMREAEGLGWGDGGEGGRGTDFGEPSPFPTVFAQPPGWNGETYSSPARAVIYPVPAPTNRFPPSVDPAADPVPVNPGPAPAPQPALAPGAPVAPAAPVRPSP